MTLFIILYAQRESCFVDSCLTLSQFDSNSIVVMSAQLNTALFILGGNHSLDISIFLPNNCVYTVDVKEAFGSSQYSEDINCEYVQPINDTSIV